MSEGDEAGGVVDAEAVLLDTDVFIELMAGGDRAAPWRPLVLGRYALVSFITAGELKAGAEIGQWGQRRRDELATRLGSVVIVPYDAALIDEYALVYAQARSKGHALGAPEQAGDRWIAATARLLAVALVTRNRRHFVGLPGLAVHTEL